MKKNNVNNTGLVNYVKQLVAAVSKADGTFPLASETFTAQDKRHTVKVRKGNEGILAGTTLGVAVTLLPVACNAGHTRQPTGPPPEYEEETAARTPASRAIDAGDAELARPPVVIRVGSESGVDLSDIPKGDVAMLDWSAIHDCYKQALAQRRYRRAEFQGRFGYTVVFRNCAEQSTPGGAEVAPSTISSCLSDVMSRAACTNGKRSPLRIWLDLEYEEPPEAGVSDARG